METASREMSLALEESFMSFIIGASRTESPTADLGGKSAMDLNHIFRYLDC